MQRATEGQGEADALIGFLVLSLLRETE
jgi:hypothetical protein